MGFDFVQGGLQICQLRLQLSLVHIDAQGERTACAVMQQTLVPVAKKY